MRGRTRYGLAAAGTVLVVVSMFLLQRDAGLSAPVESAALAGSVAAAGVALGWYQYLSDTERSDDRRPFFDSAAAYVAFWAVHWVLLVVTLGTLTPAAEGAAFRGSLLAPELSGVALVAVWTVAAWKGGIHPAANPSHWLEQYREGRRRANQE